MKKENKRYKLSLLALLICLVLGGCMGDKSGGSLDAGNWDKDSESWDATDREWDGFEESTEGKDKVGSDDGTETPTPMPAPTPEADKGTEGNNLSIPEYAGEPYAVINNNEPLFTEEEKGRTDAFETYSELDSLGRCGVAYANICKELMPTEKREGISEVKPSGWNNKPYGFVDGGYIYNRCHLIGFQLAGENANEKNLITGTRSMNVDGMLPFENLIDAYVDETGNHVLYRVTPVYEGDNLVADGVLMEAYSVEDKGEGITFHVYCYNVEPGCRIDYATGDNWEDTGKEDRKEEGEEEEGDRDVSYILNKSNHRFHLPDCSSVSQMNEENKEYCTYGRDDMLSFGYVPCRACNP